MVVELGEKLKQLRINSRLTQTQVAKRLHLTTTSISGYENGTRYPSLSSLVRLAALYHVTTDYLLGYDNTSLPDSRTINVDGLDENEIMLVSQLVELLKSKHND